jgi:hypothetical protein
LRASGVQDWEVCQKSQQLRSNRAFSRLKGEKVVLIIVIIIIIIINDS